ncbi:MAG TPA: hypothetical protein VLN72_00620 [Gillisia sp.]|nr:hypothetical protein [Gillisia sp.]
MNAQRQLLILITIALVSLIPYNGYSQNLLQKEPSQEVRELANERSRMWAKKLALSAKQQDLVEKKIIKYTMRRLEIQNAPIPIEKKTEDLLALERLERGEMRDILTKPQFDRYIFLLEQNDKKQRPTVSRKKFKN